MSLYDDLVEDTSAQELLQASVAAAAENSSSPASPVAEKAEPQPDDEKQSVDSKSAIDGEADEGPGYTTGENDSQPTQDDQQASQQQQEQKEESYPPAVFVGGIAQSTTEPGLRMYFETFGPVRQIDFKRGFAFVHFVEEATVHKCCQPGVDHTIDGKMVDVKISDPNKASASHHQLNAFKRAQFQYPVDGSGNFSSDPNSADQSQEITAAELADLQNSRDAPGMNVGRKVFVGGIAQDVREADLRQMMEHYGPIEDVVVMIDKYTRRSRGFGFVTFASLADAEKASKNRRQVLGGRECEVKLYEPGAKGHFYHSRYQGGGQQQDWNRHRPFQQFPRGGGYGQGYQQGGYGGYQQQYGGYPPYGGYAPPYAPYGQPGAQNQQYPRGGYPPRGAQQQNWQQPPQQAGGRGYMPQQQWQQQQQQQPYGYQQQSQAPSSGTSAARSYQPDQ